MNWYSQAGQDQWVVDTLGDRVGYFVDVGAYDGIETSNTYALERHFRWDGVCIEASPSIAAACASNRRCHTVAVAVAASEGYVEFAGDHIVEHGGIQVPSATLTEILRSVRAPATIDYMSLDIEGHELVALQSLDWDHYSVILLTIEHNAYASGDEYKNQIYDFMTAHDYDRVVDDAPCLDARYPQYFGKRYEDWYCARSFLTP